MNLDLILEILMYIHITIFLTTTMINIYSGWLFKNKDFDIPLSLWIIGSFFSIKFWEMTIFNFIPILNIRFLIYSLELLKEAQDERL